MASERNQSVRVHTAAIAATGSLVVNFYFPNAVRIKRYFAVPSAAEAAHATQVLDATFVNKGTNGAGATTLAVLTNDTDLADSTTRKSSAWSAAVAKELITQNRPGSPTSTQNAWDEIAAGSVIECTIAKAAGTTTGTVEAGIEFIESD